MSEGGDEKWTGAVGDIVRAVDEKMKLEDEHVKYENNEGCAQPPGKKKSTQGDSNDQRIIRSVHTHQKKKNKML